MTADFITGNISLAGRGQFTILGLLVAAFAKESALSFPLIPTCAGDQHKEILLPRLLNISIPKFQLL